MALRGINCLPASTPHDCTLQQLFHALLLLRQDNFEPVHEGV